MGAAQIKADLASLKEGEEMFAHSLKSFTETLNDLDVALHSGLQRWSGEAADAYWSFHREWRSMAGDMADRLRGLHDLLGQAHGNYGVSLATNVRMWQP